MMTAQQAADLIAPCFEGVKGDAVAVFFDRQSGRPADLPRAPLRAVGRYPATPRWRR